MEKASSVKRSPLKKYSLEIETERLLIRPFTMDDIESAHAMNLDEKVSEFTGDGGVVSLAEMERRIKEDVLGDYKKYGYGRLAVELKSTGKFIGFSGLKYLVDEQEVDLGYRFLSEYWGKGYATESVRAVIDLGFSEIGLDEIVAFVLPKNKGSIGVLKKVGFDFEEEVIEDGETALKYKLAK